MTTKTIAAAVLAVTLASAGVGCGDGGGGQPAPRLYPAAPASARPVAFTRLQPGQCFDAAPLGRAQDPVAVIPCSGPHLYEAFAVVKIASASGARYPGDDALRQRIRVTCEKALVDTRHTSLGHSAYGLFPVIPVDADTWKQGNRRLVCALFPVSMRRTTGHLPPA